MELSIPTQIFVYGMGIQLVMVVFLKVILKLEWKELKNIVLGGFIGTCVALLTWVLRY